MCENRRGRVFRHPPNRLMLQKWAVRQFWPLRQLFLSGEEFAVLLLVEPGALDIEEAKAGEPGERKGADGLALPWHGKVFVSPPYGRMLRQIAIAI
jgi:hypothetical protein